MYWCYCCLLVTTILIPVTLTCVEEATDTTTSKSYCLLTPTSPPSVADAVHACAQHGYFLVSVDTQQEANFLSSQTWWTQYGVEAYWLRLMYQEGDDWLKWLDCRQPTWVNWDPTLDNGSANRLPSTACAYASTANGHRWRSGICDSSVPDVVVCEKEADNCLIHVNDHVNGRQYCYVTQPSPYTPAQQLCQGLGYSLAQFETREEMTEVFGLFAVKSVTCFSYTGYWLGLVADADRWRWADGTALGWTNWGTPPTPSPTGAATGRGTEQCGAASSSNDLWTPTDCSEQLVMLCEKSSQTVVQSEKDAQGETPVLRAVPDNVAPAATPSPTTSAETTAEVTTDTVTTQPTTLTATVTTNSTPITTHFIVNIVPADDNVITSESTSPLSSSPPSSTTSSSISSSTEQIVRGCQEVADSPHRMVSSQQRSAGTVVKVVCSPGYVFTDGATEMATVCLPDGVWRPRLDNCSAISCPAVPVWNGLHPNTTGRKYLTSINVSCQPNFRFPSGRTSMVVTCREGGVWQPNLPVCEDTTSHSPYQLSEGIYGAIFGGVGGLLVLLWIILLCYLDVRFFKMPKVRQKKRKRKKRILEKHRNNRIVPVHSINTPLPVQPSAPPPGNPRRSSSPVTREGELTLVETIDNTQEEAGVHLVNVPHHPENVATGTSMTVLL